MTPRPPVFRGAAVLLTGASSGIGRAMALELAGDGARLALVARDRARLDEVAAECRALGAEAIAIPADVGVEAECRAAVEATVRAFGRLDMLVNDAGITMWARFDELADLAPLEHVMRVNYLGSAWCTHAALPHLVASRGRLVAVSSLAGRTGVPMRSGYAASKHAVTGFFETLRIELAPTGVSVTIAFPGFVRTRTHERAYGADGRPLGASPLQAGDLMSPEECARLILRAAARRDREIVMTARGRIGMWLKLLAPGLVDWLAARAIARGR
jgi:NAD(P)-dependent dehydrogenase (short-subunit alcohol dehydrogenase family)